MYRPVVQKLILAATSTASNATSTAVIDTLGFDRVTIGVHFTTVAETTGEIALKIGEGDTTSAFTNIDALTGGTGFTIPGAVTSTNNPQTFQFDIDCRTRKRYLQLSVTPFTTKTVTAFATFQAQEIGPAATAAGDNLLGRAAA